MTRLDQALRWWRNNDIALIPNRHLRVLLNAFAIHNPSMSLDELDWELTERGCKLLEERAKAHGEKR